MTFATMWRVIALAMLCGITGYLLFLLLMAANSLFQIGAWVFTLAAGGGASG